MKLVVVDWEDAMRFSEGWLAASDYREIAQETSPIMHTAGWLADETDGYILVARDLGDNGDLSDALRIPRGMIRNLAVLGGADPATDTADEVAPL